MTRQKVRILTSIWGVSMYIIVMHFIPFFSSHHDIENKAQINEQG